MVYKCFAKKFALLADKSAFVGTIKNENISNKELSEELHKPVIKKFKKRKLHLSFIDNIWGADITDMKLKNKFNDGIAFLLCVTDIYGKHAWVILRKIKKVLQLLMLIKNF